MSQPTTIYRLNRLLGIVSRSFLQYLKFSRPYVPSGRREVVEMLAAMVTDQDRMADRISQMITDHRELPRTGEFPMEFTDMHDLEIDFLIRVAIDYQRQDVLSIGQLARQLQLAPAAKSLAEETLGMAKGHLQMLEALALEQGSDEVRVRA
jgi:predicted outer membrane protein